MGSEKEGRYLAVALLVSSEAGASFEESIATVVALADCWTMIAL